MSVLVALAAVSAAPSTPVGAQPSPGLESVFAGCAPGAPRQVGLLVGDTDQARLDVVADLATQLGGAAPVEVLVAGARGGVKVLARWQPPDPDRSSSLADAVRRAALGDIDDPDTPFSLSSGLEGIARELEARAAEAPDGEPSRCSIVLAVAPQVDLGEGSPCGIVTSALAPLGAGVWIAAPTVDPADVTPVAGGRWACGDGGVVVELPGPVELAREAARIGAHVRDAGVVERPLPACADGPCDEGRWAFSLDRVLGSAVFTVVLPTDHSWVQVGLPWGADVSIEDRSSGAVGAGSFVLQPTWVTPSVLRLHAELDPSEDDWPGEWSLSVVTPGGTEAEAVVVAATELGVAPRFTSTPRIVVGRSVTVSVELYDRTGRYVSATPMTSVLTVRVVAVGPEGRPVAESVLEPDGSGGFRGHLAGPGEDVDAGSLSLVATVEASTNLVSVPATEGRALARVIGAEAWPRFTTDVVVVRGDRGGQAQGRLSVASSGELEACVWVEESEVPLGDVVVTVVVGDGARSAASCAAVPSGSSGSVVVTVDLPGDLDAGLHEGRLLVGLGSRAADSHDLVELALVVEVSEPIDTLRRALLTALLALIGLGLPLVAVWLLDFATARFRPARHALVAEIPLAVWPDGSLHRADARTVLLVGNDMFESAALRRARRMHTRGLTFAVRNPRSPLRPPIGTVSSPTGPVIASDGVVLDGRSVLGRVPMHLRDTWIFELDPDRTRRAALDPAASDFQAAYGRLVMFRASAEADPVDLAPLPRLAKGLAQRARSTAGVERSTAQEMLEFVDVNVSAPRDLPRSSRPAGDGQPELSEGPGGGPGGAYEFVGFEGAITFDGFEDLEDEVGPHGLEVGDEEPETDPRGDDPERG